MEGADSVYAIERALRKQEQNVHKRLKSILFDAAFLEDFRRLMPLPVVANLRCGLWYSPKFDAECYFKSTDGHYGKWQFNLRRINLNVLKLALGVSSPVNRQYQHRGCIIVDSTRKGKAFPDSFNRTIPIWIAVLNRLMFKIKSDQLNVDSSEKSIWNEFVLPPWISPSEKAQIEAILPLFTESILKSEVIMETLRAMSARFVTPLRAILLNPHSKPWRPNLDELEFTPILLLSVSKMQGDGKDYDYIQGAADDHDTWSKGLEAKMFWDNVDFLMEREDGIEKRIQQLVDASRFENLEQYNELLVDSGPLDSAVRVGAIYHEVRGTPIAISASPAVCVNQIWEDFGLFVNVSELEIHEFASIGAKSSSGHEPVSEIEYLVSPIPIGKESKWVVTRSLPKILKCVWRHLKLGHKILIFDAQDISLAFGIAVAIAANFFDASNGHLSPLPNVVHSKDSLKDALYFVQQRCFEAKVPRLLIAELNRFFLSPPETIPPHLRDYWDDMVREANQETTK